MLALCEAPLKTHTLVSAALGIRREDTEKSKDSLVTGERKSANGYRNR